MKLLVYSHAFAPQVGGIETFVMSLAKGLTAPSGEHSVQRLEITVVTQTPDPNKNALSNPAFQVVRQPKVVALWQLIRSTETVLLAGPAILPLLFALLLGKRAIVSHHGYQSICPNGMHFQFPLQQSCPGHFAAGRYLECVQCNVPQLKLTGSVKLLFLTHIRRFLAKLADANVAVSEHVSDRISLPHARVICNGVPVVPAAALNTASSHLAGPPSFAYVGRLVTEKGVNVLIDAAGILKSRGCQFEVLIIGDGPERQALEVQAASLQLAGFVRFLGFLFDANLQKALHEVSTIVMPSICEDAAPFLALEQMIQSRLIIGSKIGGLAEELGDAGLTFPPGSAPGLADRIQEVIGHPESITRLGRLARERVLQRYTFDRMLQEYQGLLFSTLYDIR